MVESEGQTVTLGQYYTHEVKTMLAGCPDEEVRQQLAIFGMRNFPLLFKNYRKFSDSNKGHVSHRHLLNYLNKAYPDILQ